MIALGTHVEPLEVQYIAAWAGLLGLWGWPSGARPEDAPSPGGLARGGALGARVATRTLPAPESPRCSVPGRKPGVSPRRAWLAWLWPHTGGLTRPRAEAYAPSLSVSVSKPLSLARQTGQSLAKYWVFRPDSPVLPRLCPSWPPLGGLGPAKPDSRQGSNARTRALWNPWRYKILLPGPVCWASGAGPLGLAPGGPARGRSQPRGAGPRRRPRCTVSGGKPGVSPQRS